ncbi:farnesyl diphosphate synthase [Oceanicola granulosus HTCC2516]|uniref:Geranylgeranyl diphosphate synthase n=1 Tax=Oceanicola granulosus (strain ATCC BAA-861 / DSM 15982 / KCTC 12143 / HTCC2516) TaxID=314256 RepID=Q2CD60_OCEGH|nr:polyprenyl synthetase family protein [Oceanicola granulosus]EAR50618.1 farnesyl diphosphate synthase [Oceanicola granulosus HTCC2516]
MPADFDAALAAARDAVAARLAARPRGVSGPLEAASDYALEGGKGLRAFLVLEGARLCGLAPGAALGAAAAIECVHAYSLVHDDLPAMDDDDIRRGRPTVHKAWDEATAILVGDALQALAFEEVLACDAPPERLVALARGLAEAAGARGMVAGQMLDIAAESAVAPMTLADVERIQSHKTGALIVWSATAGAHLAGADPAPFARYGAALGLAFQIADDLLDATGDAAEVGKAVDKDAAAGKATFVSLQGVAAAKGRAEELVEVACNVLSPFGEQAATLREAARFVIARRK